jgi:cell division protein ZapB
MPLTGSPGRSILINKLSRGIPLDIKKLEERVDELISTVERLRSENKTLRQSQTHLAAERDKLITKTEQARRRVESMIERLKAMDNE